MKKKLLHEKTFTTLVIQSSFHLKKKERFDQDNVVTSC